jgi:hypothetical protein
MADENPLGKTIVARWETEDAKRATWKPLWQSCSRYALPNEASFQETITPGTERTRYILDSTAPRSLELFASFLHTLLNNPSSKWITMGIDGEDPTRYTLPEKQWFENVAQIMQSSMAAPKADVYSQLHQLYLMLGNAGTGVLYVDMDAEKDLRIRQYHIDDCVIWEDESEMVNGIIRRRKYSRRQALSKWPDKDLGESFKNRPTQDPSKWLDEELTFYHGCMASKEAEEFDTKLKENFPFVATWVEEKAKHVISQEGYEEFPYIAGRWYKARGEVWGRSPTMTAMPDIRMVNRMSDTILRGAEKIVDPPIVIPDGGLVSPVRLSPGGITYSEGQIEPKTLIPPGTSRIETGNQLLEQRQQAIREAYFVPLFVTPESPVKTATQVLQEVDERNRAVSPMLVRVQGEVLQRLTRRVYGLLARAEKFPVPPSSILDPKRQLKVDYQSPLIASQRQMEGLSVVRLFETLAPWGQIDPGVFDNVDPDEVAKVLHMASNAPTSIWRSESKRDAVRAARFKQMEAQQQMEMLKNGGDTFAKIASATKTSDG